MNTDTSIDVEPGLAPKVRGESREQQDNEQYHLLILEEPTHRAPEGYVRYREIPQILAFVYYQLSWILFVVKLRCVLGLEGVFGRLVI